MPYIHRSSQRFWTSRRAILCGFAGLAGASAVPANGEAEFSFGLTPVFLDNNMTLLSLLHEYLAQQVGRPVAFVKRRTYQEISSLLLSGQLDAASICDFSYVQYQDRLALLAVPLYRNQPLHQAYVIVNEASEARTFDDIRGTVHAFSDPDSTSGYLITRWLLALRRENPAEFFRSFFFTYGYRNVIRAVATRLAESGSVEGYVWDVMKERRPELVDKTRIVFRSERLGFPPVVALETSRDRTVTQALVAAMLGMTSDRLGREILSILELDGFTMASPALYESTAEKWRVVKAQV
jgi:ABC-type phosphate/phosphonate transport system substrate-binding protein